MRFTHTIGSRSGRELLVHVLVIVGFMAPGAETDARSLGDRTAVTAGDIERLQRCGRSIGSRPRQMPRPLASSMSRSVRSPLYDLRRIEGGIARRLGAPSLKVISPRTGAVRQASRRPSG